MYEKQNKMVLCEEITCIYTVVHYGNAMFYLLGLVVKVLQKSKIFPWFKDKVPTICYGLSNLDGVLSNTVEPVLKDHPIGHKNVVCQDRWSLVTGSVILKCRSFYQKCVVCQDRWSLMAAVSQDSFSR